MAKIRASEEIVKSLLKWFTAMESELFLLLREPEMSPKRSVHLATENYLRI